MKMNTNGGFSPVRLAEGPSKLTHGLFETDQRSDV